MPGIRTQWEAKNKLHWVLDIAFNEDCDQTREDYGAENLSILRRWGLSLVRPEGSDVGSVKNQKTCQLGRSLPESTIKLSP
jgi:predicted transposase YbfD/YdcC